MKTETSKLQSQIQADALFKQCVSLQEKLISADIDNEILERKIKELNSKIESLKMVDLEKELFNVNAQKRSLSNELEDLKDHFQRMEEHANLMAALKTTAESDRINLERQSASLARIRQSFSFKVTKPIRWLEKKLMSSSSISESTFRPVTVPNVEISEANTNTKNDARSPDILFLIGCWEGESKRYRVYNIIEGLKSLGYSAESMDASKGQDIIEKKLRPKVIVYFRAPYDYRHNVANVIDYCKLNSITLCYDIDDYVFEPNLISQIAAIQTLTPEQHKDYEWGVRAYRSLMLNCDRVTASTQFLTDRIAHLGRKASTVINSVNDAQLQAAERLLAEPKASDELVRIGYFSGSATHSMDFAECAEGLKIAMRNNPQIIFRLAGYLELDSSWDEFKLRIERKAFMSPQQLLASQHECDITLAPLEENNDFCHGKSELKYFESALVEVPTIASRTDTFIRAIDQGVTGFLASSPKEWADTILLLAKDATKRSAVGRAAREAVLKKYTATAAAQAALYAYGLELKPSELKEQRANPLKIGWIVPGLIIGGGGHRNILRAAYHLETFGHKVSLYFSDTNMSAAELRRTVRQHFYPFNGAVHKFDAESVDKLDVLMATHWSTVALADSVKDKTSEIMYFVQDFEPAFYPMGSEYIMAENTYRKNLYAICSGPWCERLLKSEYKMEADHFRFPVDQEIYHPRANMTRKKRILFFAKPDMPRRCFLIGVEALREFHKLRPDYEIMFYGSEAARSHPLDFPVTFCGILPTINDLADIYASSSIGMVFSTTNPSLVPYEMMACGLPVVDLGRPGNEVNYADRQDIALLADPDPVKMAKEIAALLTDEVALKSRTEKGIEFAQSFPTEDDMALRVEELLVARWESKQRPLRRKSK